MRIEHSQAADAYKRYARRRRLPAGEIGALGLVFMEGHPDLERFGVRFQDAEGPCVIAWPELIRWARTCPDCGVPDTRTLEQARRGYRCDGCTAAAEFGA